MKKLFIQILLLTCCLGFTMCEPEFTMNDVVFTVEVQTNNEEYGHVTGGGRFHYKEEITLQAMPSTNYEFIAWSDGVKDNPRKFAVVTDTTLTATFQSIPKYTITVLSNDTNMGTVSGGGTYNRDTKLTLRATSTIGDFVQWHDGMTESTRTVTVTEDATYTAYFTITEADGHIYVDLGLPSGTLWANCNVGATNSEDYGDYFAFGETSTKNSYSWKNYVYCEDGDYRKLTKYCNHSEYGKDKFTDNKLFLESTDDAAIVHWGGRWRTPTPIELQELLDECIWTWTQVNSIYGYNVQGKNGKSIFLPAAGMYKDSDLRNKRTFGYYLSSIIAEMTYSYDMCLLLFQHHSYYGIGQGMYAKMERCYGVSVRPVIGKTTYAIVASASNGTMGSVNGSGTYAIGTSATLRAISNSGYRFAHWSDGNTDNIRKITVVQDINLTAYFEEWSGTPKTGSRAYVDLGLPSGTLWATCNVGATSPTSIGYTFAWGETVTKTTYGWSSSGNYKWGVINWDDEINYGLTKYNATDGKVVLEAEDDAATVHWGGDWRTPTKAEQDELRTECDWQWTDAYNSTSQAGYIVTSKMDATKHIFLPVTSTGGSYWSRYWSSSLCKNRPYEAYYFGFNSDSYNWYLGNRCEGLTVRPVCSSQ